ncbi:MAG: FhaA domain-containing protein, partial [Chloroflexota bacterium]
MAENIQKFENAARTLIEGFFSRVLDVRLEPRRVATDLARALEASSSAPDGNIDNTYIITANPKDLDQLLGQFPTLDHTYSNFMLQLANQLDIDIVKPPLIIFQANQEFESNRYEISSSYEEALTPDQTEYYKAINIEDDVMGAIKTRDAYLIVDGILHVPLDRSVIRIGRRQDNDIVLESKSVSRLHAQIRWRYNRFIIYDLGSRAGVMVNDERVDEYVLKAGDVIKLSHINLIYGEGNTRPVTTRTNMT